MTLLQEHPDWLAQEGIREEVLEQNMLGYGGHEILHFPQPEVIYKKGRSTDSVNNVGHLHGKPTVSTPDNDSEVMHRDQLRTETSSSISSSPDDVASLANSTIAKENPNENLINAVELTQNVSKDWPNSSSGSDSEFLNETEDKPTSSTTTEALNLWRAEDNELNEVYLTDDHMKIDPSPEQIKGNYPFTSLSSNLMSEAKPVNEVDPAEDEALLESDEDGSIHKGQSGATNAMPRSEDIPPEDENRSTEIGARLSQTDEEARISEGDMVTTSNHPKMTSKQIPHKGGVATADSVEEISTAGNPADDEVISNLSYQDEGSEASDEKNIIGGTESLRNISRSAEHVQSSTAKTAAAFRHPKFIDDINTNN